MNTTAMAKACLAAATALQQLAAALEADPDLATMTAIDTVGTVALHSQRVTLEEWQHHARRVVIPDPPASVAEPECGCSLYTRCELHENGRARNCTCNGPTYRNSTCGIAEHRMVASSMPDRDPALLD